MVPDSLPAGGAPGGRAGSGGTHLPGSVGLHGLHVTLQLFFLFDQLLAEHLQILVALLLSLQLGL